MIEIWKLSLRLFLYVIVSSPGCLQTFSVAPVDGTRTIKVYRCNIIFKIQFLIMDCELVLITPLKSNVLSILHYYLLYHVLLYCIALQQEQVVFTC